MDGLKKYMEDPFFKPVLACVIVLLCEIPLFYLGKYLSVPTVYHCLVMLIFWSLSASIIIRIVQKRLKYDPFAVKTQPTSQQMSYAVAITVVFILFTTLLYGNSKLLLNLDAYGLQSYIIIALYEVAETLVLMLLFLYSQHLVERYTNDPSKPHGVIVLMIVMGLMFTLMNGAIMGIYMMIMGFCVGYIFKFVRKNPAITLALFIIMYLL